MERSVRLLRPCRLYHSLEPFLSYPEGGSDEPRPSPYSQQRNHLCPTDSIRVPALCCRSSGRPTVQLRVSCLRDSPGNKEDRAGALCAGLWLGGTASPTWPVGTSKSKEHLTDSSPLLAVADAYCSLMIRSGDFHVLMDRKPGPGQLNGVQLSQPGCSPVALPILHPALSLSFLSHQ